MVKLRNIADFITSNQLEDFEWEYGFDDLVCFVPVKGYDIDKVYLDYTLDIETGISEIQYWDCRDEDDDKHIVTVIDAEEAFRLRGLS